MEDSTELTDLLDHCSDWAKRTDEQIGSGGIFIFGSTIYRGGEQFDGAKSDVDLVVIFPRTVTTAPARVEWLERLAKAKHDLELSLIPVLGQTDAGKPMVSIVPVTEHEVRADIHKSAVPNFFRGGPFQSLLDLETPAAALLTEDPKPIPNGAQQVVQFVQGFRNKYLGSSAAKRVALEPWDGDDPVPKDVMRYTALVRGKGDDDSARFDVQIGLDEIANHIYGIRDSHPSYLELHERISVRRGGRGRKKPLSPEHYLLLAETLFDLCSLGDLVAPPVGQPAVPVPALVNVGHAPALIPTEFVVRADNRLAGRADEIRATIEEASLNAKWRRLPAFVVRMQELAEIEGQLAEIKDDQSPAARSRRTQLIDRKTQIELVKPLIDLGLEHLVLYQRCLLPADRYPKRYSSVLARAMNTFIGRCFNWRTRGGALEAWTEWDDKQVAVGFSLPDYEYHSYLTGQFGEANPMCLAAENKPICTLSPQSVAQWFVPELVLHFVVREVFDKRPFASPEQKEFLLTTSNWRFGVK